VHLATLAGGKSTYDDSSDTDMHATKMNPTTLVVATTTFAEQSQATEMARLVIGNHPYQQPQWIVLEVADTTNSYENWVRESVIQVEAKDA